MDATGLNRIIEAMTVHFLVAETRKVVKPVFLKNTIEQKSVLIKTEQGNFYADKALTPVQANTFYFVPAGSRFFFSTENHPILKFLKMKGSPRPSSAKCIYVRLKRAVKSR